MKKVETLVYLIKLFNGETQKHEFEFALSNGREIAKTLISIYNIIDGNIYLDTKMLIACLSRFNEESGALDKIINICEGPKTKIHSNKLAEILTKEELDELIIALIQGGIKEYAKYLINLDVK